MELVIRPAKSSNLKEVTKLLLDNQLPTDDIIDRKNYFFIALINNVIVGTIGVEKYKNVGLLRSLAVNKEYRNLNIAKKLLIHLFDYCSSKKIEQLYLLTTTAEEYFYRYGFHIIDRYKVPDVISKTNEFNDICPLSAVVMFKNQ